MTATGVATLIASLQAWRRPLNAAAALSCVALVGFAYYHLQARLGLDPCPLCILQRAAFLLTALLFLIAALHRPGRTGSRLYGILIATSALTGAGIAGWHVHLQHLPPGQVPECGPGLDYMLEVFPLNQTLHMVFTGSGECADVLWSFLGLSIPAWSLVCFLALAGAGLLINWLPAGEGHH
jgi:disulfide bond formation protein DsbB